jgi:hypothetical protein
MANVINRTTGQYLVSVNTPDYLPADWIINPSVPDGVAQKYWKVVGDSVVEMTAEEKAQVDGALAVAPTFLGSSIAVQNEVEVTSSEFSGVGGIVTTPSFFGSLASLRCKLIGSYKTTGLGAELRFVEDDTKVMGTFSLPDSSGAWQTMEWFTDVEPSEGTREYILEAKLGAASSAYLRFVSMSLLSFGQ